MECLAASAALTAVARGDDPVPNPGRAITFQETLEKGLRVRTDEEKAFIARVVATVEDGQLQEDLVRSVFSGGSPKYTTDDLLKERASLKQGFNVTGDELSTSELGRRGKYTEMRGSPSTLLSKSEYRSPSKANRSIDHLTKSERKMLSGSEESRETTMMKLEHERVIKDIIDAEKEVLDWNREYQRTRLI